jgi:AraC family transcriptional regulator
MNTAVEQAIRFMCESYEEPLSLGDIADKAIMSRFHFCRLFKQHTGVTPGRFLSAVRIYQAKRMLLTTSMSITEIAFAVGYNSLGSFSNHFADSVGVSPGRFRRIVRDGDFQPGDRSAYPCLADGCVSGEITFPDGYRQGRVYVGAFDSPIVQRRPARAALLDLDAMDTPAAFRLERVPVGTWFISAVAVADTTDPEPWTRTTLLIGGFEPVEVTAGAELAANVAMRPRCPTDLPILLALPDLEARVEGFAQDERVPVSA